MPVTNGVGHSAVTVVKERDFAALLRLHMSIVRGIQTRGWCHRDYHYIDTNAGAGLNEPEGEESASLPGSPLVFLKAAAELGMAYQADFIEIQSGNATRLYETLCGLPGYCSRRARVRLGDHNDIVPEVLKRLPANALGLIYVDPNGVPPFGMLRAASLQAQCKRLDMLLRVSGVALKRARRQGSLVDNLAGIAKQHWLVQRPLAGDPWQWTFLLGTNWPAYPDWRGKEFWAADSAEGRAILDKLNYTSREREQRAQSTFLQRLSLPDTGKGV